MLRRQTPSALQSTVQDSLITPVKPQWKLMLSSPCPVHERSQSSSIHVLQRRGKQEGERNACHNCFQIISLFFQHSLFLVPRWSEHFVCMSILVHREDVFLLYLVTYVAIRKLKQLIPCACQGADCCPGSACARGGGYQPAAAIITAEDYSSEG